MSGTKIIPLRQELLAGLLALFMVTAACAQPLTSTRVTSTGGGPDVNQAMSEAYDGPKARIAVSRFVDKTHAGHRLSHGMEDMLTTALFESGRFVVLERRQLDDVIAEQDIGQSGRFDRRTVAPIGKLEGAELLVTASVTEWDPGTGRARGSLSRLPVPGRQLLGTIAGNMKEAHIGIDLRLIDTARGRVVAATSVEGKSRGFGGRVSGRSFVDGVGAALGGSKKSALDGAMREVIQQSVAFVASKTPNQFYRY